MLFPTVEYALFFLATIFLSWGLLQIKPVLVRLRLTRQRYSHREVVSHKLHKYFLLFVSYVFYGCFDWHFVPLLFSISSLAWAVSRAIQRNSKNLVAKNIYYLKFGITLCLLVLAYYKYFGFFLQNFSAVYTWLGDHVKVQAEIPILPLGISFMTFHAISMMMDAWRDKLNEPVSFSDALLYVSFFPQLIAGPILRASNFLPQLRQQPAADRLDTTRALMLIVSGLFKKVVIANTLSTLLVDDVFSNPIVFSASQVLLGIYGYAAQIYCDFSGYTDIAIGCALLLGYRFPANFNAPYAAASPHEFWRRWHISLSTWLRDYLYIPLGGSRGGHWQTQRNLMLTMLLGGLWHGAAWNFVLWGGWQGLLLAGHREWERFWLSRNATWRSSASWRWISRAMMFHAVCLGWVLFRSADFASAVALLARLRYGTWGADLPLGPLLCVVAGIGAQFIPRRWLWRLQRSCMCMAPLVRGVALATVLVLCEVLGPSEPAPFIYFQF